MNPLLLGTVAEEGVESAIIISDSFAGGGVLNGRTPDTVNNGNNWYESGLFPGNQYELTGTTCYNPSASLEYALIDPALDDYKVYHRCFGSGVGVGNREFLESRVSGMVNPSERITIQVDPEIDQITAIERVGGVNSLLGAFTAVLPLDAEYLVAVTLLGATVTIESLYNGESGVFATSASTGGALGFRCFDDGGGNLGVMKGPFEVESI